MPHHLFFFFQVLGMPIETLWSGADARAAICSEKRLAWEQVWQIRLKVKLPQLFQGVAAMQPVLFLEKSYVPDFWTENREYHNILTKFCWTCVLLSSRRNAEQDWLASVTQQYSALTAYPNSHVKQTTKTHCLPRQGLDFQLISQDSKKLHSELIMKSYLLCGHS